MAAIIGPLLHHYPGHDPSTLFICEAGSLRAATLDETIQAALNALAQKFRRGRSLKSPRLMREYLQFALSEKEHEIFWVVLLGKRHRLIACLEMFRGTIDGASVHPREVIKEALLSVPRPECAAESSFAPRICPIRNSPLFYSL